MDLNKTVTVTRRPTTISWLIPFAVKFLKQKRYIYIYMRVSGECDSSRETRERDEDKAARQV